MNLINRNQGIFEGDTSQEMVLQRILIQERVFINCWQVVNGPDGRKDFLIVAQQMENTDEKIIEKVMYCFKSHMRSERSTPPKFTPAGIMASIKETD